MTAARLIAARCAALVDATWFTLTGFGVIVLNAVLLGLETYEGLVAATGSALRIAEHCCLVLFAIELLIRFGARLDAPGRFFRDGWNIFDLVIVVAPLLPGVRENVTVLRMLRLARILRTFRLFPSLRVILVGIRRALPGLGSFLLVTVLVIYGYAMLGWMMFGEAYPERYGTVGQAMLTLFLLLSLDGITDTLEAGREVSGGAVLYYVSYMVAACYLLTNLLVGLVLTALQEAHEAERAAARGPKVAGPTIPIQVDPALSPAQPAASQSSADQLDPAPLPSVRQHLAEVRATLDALERRLAQEEPTVVTAGSEPVRPS